VETTTVRVGIIGVGNCAASLVQGLAHYAEGASSQGLMHRRLGGIGIQNLQIVSAFDIAVGKVGRDLSDAIVAPPNNTLQLADITRTGVEVLRGPTLDGLGRYVRDVVEESSAPVVDVVRALRSSRTEVLVSYLPVGAEEAARFWAGCALEAGCAFVNCMPAFLASDPAWAERFSRARLPIVGDDVKSQLGATILHRTLVELLVMRGIDVERTSQLNVGGNADFRNMLERERLVSKKISKTRAVTSRLGTPLPADSVHVGPSDFVPWLEDRKWAHVRIEGRGFAGAPMAIELKLEVWDSPNSAGVVVDAIRCAALGLARGIGGPLDAACSAYMKSPPEQLSDWEAHERLAAFMEGAQRDANEAPPSPLRGRAS